MMTEPRQDQRPARLHPQHRALVVESCALATIAAYLAALATVLPTAGVVAVGMCAGLTAAGVTLALAESGWLAGSVAGWAVALPGWLLYARLAHRPYAALTVAALVIPAVLLTAWSLVAYAGLHDQRRQARLAEQRRAAHAALAGWGQMFDRLGVEGVRAVKETESRAGRDVALVLPSSGKVTIRTLQGVAEGVAIARHLQPAAVYFGQGRTAAEVVMHLDEHDVLAEDLPLPEDTGRLTVNEPLAVGATGDDNPALVLLRGVSALVLGATNMGKTNLLHVLIALLTRCTDVVVFAIDLKGGRLAAPWISPWIDGECPRPAIDWVATTRDEAHRMLLAVERVIDARGASLAGGSKLTPSPELPQFVLLADEIADIFGDRPRPLQGGGPTNTVMAAIGSRITRTQRSEACMPVWATQRGTGSMTGGGDIKSQCLLRFALGTASEADARAAVPDSEAAARLLARLRHPGTAIIWMPAQARPVPVKIYRLDPDEAKPHGREDAAKLRRLAVAAGHHVTVPDALAQQAMGDDYTRRWERSALYRSMAPESPAAPDLAAEPAPARPARPQSEVADEARALLEGIGLAGARPDPHARVFALLAGHPQFGLSAMEIGARLAREGLGVHRVTIHKWLREDIAAGRIEKRGKDGPGARYKLPR